MLRVHRKGLVCIFISLGNENRGSAPSSRRRQQPTGLLHLIVRVPSSDIILKGLSHVG